MTFIISHFHRVATASEPSCVSKTNRIGLKFVESLFASSTDLTKIEIRHFLVSFFVLLSTSWHPMIWLRGIDLDFWFVLVQVLVHCSSFTMVRLVSLRVKVTQPGRPGKIYRLFFHQFFEFSEYVQIKPLFLESLCKHFILSFYRIQTLTNSPKI
jgi:hypothetical protein